MAIQSEITDSLTPDSNLIQSLSSSHVAHKSTTKANIPASQPEIANNVSNQQVTNSSEPADDHVTSKTDSSTDHQVADTTTHQVELGSSVNNGHEGAVSDVRAPDQEKQIVVGSDRYDKLKSWPTVKSRIKEMIDLRLDEEEPMMISAGLECLDTLELSNVMKCITCVPGSTGDMFVTQHSIGVTNQITLWTIPKGSFNLTLQIYEVVPEIKKICYIKKYRVFVAYCGDMTLRVFSDMTHSCRELSSVPCQYTVNSLCYVSSKDEIVTGGLGFLHSWKVANYRVGLEFLRSYRRPALAMDEWVVHIRHDDKTSRLLIQTDYNIYVVSTQESTLLCHQPSNHSSQLTCTTYYARLDYFITASRDGVIKIWHSHHYNYMHQFLGHMDKVTSLSVHQGEPLLISSSLDGTIRLWRLDTFEPEQCLHIGEPLLGFRLLGTRNLVYWTEKHVKHCQLNLLNRLFNAVQSRVRKLTRWGSEGKANRIIASMEDGSIRLLSPASGTAVTIVYPLMTHLVPTYVVYDSVKNLLYAFLQGSVLVYDCTTNPCSPLHQLSTPQHGPESPVHSIALYTKAVSGVRNLWSKALSTEQTESLVFAGHADGMIRLIVADRLSMSRGVKGHQSPVLLLETSVPLSGDSLPVVARTECLLSCGSDRFIVVWEVCHTDSKVMLNCITKFHVPAVPKTICMLGNVISTLDNHNGTVTFYQLSDDCRVQILHHAMEDNHISPVCDVSCCAELRVFATSSQDGVVKIWCGESGQLIREIELHEPISGMCFANPRGDILIGFRNHIYSLSVVDYLPSDILENLLTRHFLPDVKEEHIAFNNQHHISGENRLPHIYPFDLDGRRQLLREEKVLLRSVLRTAYGGRHYTSRLQAIVTKYYNLVDRKAEKKVRQDNSIHSVRSQRSSRFSHLTAASQETVADAGYKTWTAEGTTSDYSSQQSADDSHDALSTTSGYVSDFAQQPSGLDSSGSSTSYCSDPEADHEGDMGPQRRKSSMKLGEKWRIGKNKSMSASRKKGSKKKLADVVEQTKAHEEETVVTEEETEEQKKANLLKAEEERRKKFPIAPDGYIPNSVIRQRFVAYQRPPPTPPTDEPWRLKPCPGKSDSQLSQKHSSRMTDNEITLYLSDTSLSNHNEEEDEVEIPSVARHTPSQSDISMSRESTLTVTPRDLRSKPRPDVRQTPDLSTPKRKKPLSRQGTRTFAISEEEEGDIPDLLRQIAKEAWFPKSVALTMAGITSGLTAILSNMSPQVHRQICDYIIRIHQELGFPDVQRDKIVAKLLEHLHHGNAIFRGNAVRTLGHLGVNRKDIITGIMPLLTDMVDDVRTEAHVAMKMIAGVESKDALYKLLSNMGILQMYASKEDEEAALRQLAGKGTASGKVDMVTGLPSQEEKEEIKIESWLNDAKETDKDMSDLYREDTDIQSQRGARSRAKPGATSHVGSRAGTGTSSRVSRDQRHQGGIRGLKPHKEIEEPSTSLRHRPAAKLGKSKRKPFQGMQKEIAKSDSAFSDESSLSFGPPWDENSETIKSSLPSRRKQRRPGLYPDNPALYRLYDSQRAPEPITDTHDEEGSPEPSSRPSSMNATRGQAADSKPLSVSISTGQEQPDDLSDQDTGRGKSSGSQKKANETGSAKVTRFEDTPVTPKTTIAAEEDSGLGNTATSDDQSTSRSRDKAGTYSGPGARGLTNLSPVLSSDVGDKEPVAAHTEDESWRQFFDRPSAQERRNKHMDRHFYDDASLESSRNLKDSINLPPIRYLGDDVELVAGDPGIRLLHSISVKPKSFDSASSDDMKRHRIDAVPGKLTCNTTTEDTGYTKYGILGYHWTTGVPAYGSMCRRYIAHRTRNGVTSRHLVNGQDNSHLAKFQNLRFDLESVESEATSSQLNDDKFLPSLVQEEAGFEWAKPLPPAPDRESRNADPTLRHEHKHYCDYYRLLKKRLHDHISVSAPRTCLPKINIIRPLPGDDQQLQVPRSTIPRSPLLPPISWRNVLTCDM